jgi:hypothetical protein
MSGYKDWHHHGALLLLPKLTPFREWYLCFCGFLMPLRCALRFWLLRAPTKATKCASAPCYTVSFPPSLPLIPCTKAKLQQLQFLAAQIALLCSVVLAAVTEQQTSTRQ